MADFTGTSSAAADLWAAALHTTTSAVTLLSAAHTVPALLVLLAPGVGQLLHMLGWRALLPRAARPTLGRSYFIFLAAQAGNELGGVLGEPIKVAAVPARFRDEAVAAVLLDNATAFVALATLLGGGAGTVGLSVLAPHLQGRAITVHFALAVVFVLVGFALLRALVPRFRRRLEALTEAVERTLRECRRVASTRPADLTAAAALHLLGKAWIIVEFWLLLACFDLATVKTAALLGVASAAGSTVGSGIPGQLGAVESAVVGASALSGLDATTAVAIALGRRLRGGLWIALGAIAGASLLRRKAPTRSPLPAPPPTVSTLGNRS